MSYPFKALVVVSLVCISSRLCVSLAEASQFTLVPVDSTFVNDGTDDCFNDSL